MLTPTISTDKPRNRRMDILRAIAIVLVVLGHNFPAPGLTWFNLYFPMAPYRMAIFLFASGYFFRDLKWSEYPSFVWRKTKGLALPLLGWNIVYAVIASVLCYGDVVDYISSLPNIWSLGNLFAEPFFSGHQYTLNLAAWFVGMLYPALLLYGILHILNSRKISDHILLILYALLAVGGLAVAHVAKENHYWLLPLHLTYALFFIHFGKYYRQYIEPYIERVSSWLLIPACCLFSWLTVRIGGNVQYSLAWMEYDGRIIMPLLMAIAGIVLWMRISRIIEQHVIPNRLEKAISESTWDIMTHHLLVKFLVGWVLVHWAIEPELTYPFRASIWFLPATIDYWLLIAIEVALPVIWHYLFAFVKKQVGNLRISK